MHQLARALPEYVPIPNVGPLVAALGPVIKEYVDGLVDEAVIEGALRGTEATLVANHGSAMGEAIFALLTRRAEESNLTLVHGAVTRQAVSKAVCKLRRGFGMPIEYARQARPKGASTTTKSE